MKIKSMFLGLFLFVLTISITACTNDSESNSSSQGSDTQTLRIFNSKGESAIQFQELANTYYEETGIKVEVFSVGMGENHIIPLRSEMTSQRPPHIFTVQGVKELYDWRDGNFILDMSTISNHEEFQALVNNIPMELRLTTDGINSYGIPYNVEGYGYIVDKQMLIDLFQDIDAYNLIEDIILATYEEWKTLIIKLDAYIQNPSAATVIINGNQYTFNEEKVGLAENLTGVFAVMGAEPWTYGDHFVNIALNAIFSTPAQAYQATSEDLQQLYDALVIYANALNFKTSHLAGANGQAQRGFDFVSSANFGYDQTINIFAESKAVFLKQGNWAENNIRNANPYVAERLTFLPIKMPFTQDMIQVPDLTVEQLNSSIPVFVPMYYAVNATVSEEEQLMAFDFLLWLNTSETGQRFIVEELLFIPYTIDTQVYDNIGFPLGDSIISYIYRDRVLGAPFLGAPGPWPHDLFGIGIMERYMTRLEWTEEDYSDIALFGISSWQGLLQQ